MITFTIINIKPKYFSQLIQLTFLLCIILFNGPLKAQVKEMHLTQFTTESGLPSNMIRGLEWDNTTNFLWITTGAGIVRFNGVEFKSYNKEKVSPLAPEKSVYSIRNHFGNIFISDGSGNLYEIKKNEPVLSKSVSSSKSYLNNYFIGVSDIFFETKLKADFKFDFAIDKLVSINDTACLIRANNQIYYYSLKLAKPQQFLHTDSKILKLFKINNDCFYVDEFFSYYKINLENKTSQKISIKGLLNSNLSTQLFWQNGLDNPVVIEKNKAYYLTYVNEQIQANLISTSLPKDADIYTAAYHKNNNLLFVGTESVGIIMLSPNLAIPKKRIEKNAKNKNAYYSQILLSNGNVLTNEGDEVGDAVGLAAPKPISGKFSNRISYTADSVLWYNSKEPDSKNLFLHQFNPIKKITKVFEKIKITTQVASTNNETYLANNIGIGKLSGDSITYAYKYPSNIPNLNTYDFQEIQKGIFAIAGCSGLLRFNTATSKLDTIFAIPNACFGGIWRYKDYVFWGSYGYGYFIYKNGVVKKMPIDKNQFLLYTHCFVLDDFGYCWISTNRGLFKAKLDDILLNFENTTSSVYYHYLGKNDGLDITELNGGCTPCALKVNKYTISFPTMDGLLWLNTEAAKPLLPTGEIFIDEILIDNKSYSVDSLVSKSLSNKAKELTFKLGFSAWCGKENLYVEYQLNDTLNWRLIKTEENSFIRFANLSAGNYTLIIRKLNGFGSNNYTYKKIKFSIAKPWYNQNWFYILLAAVTFMLFVLFYKLRTRNLKRRQVKLEKQVLEKTDELQQKNDILEKSNSINTRLISIISHDIITPLKFLNVAGKNLLEKKSLMSEALKDETVLEITNTSKELQLLSTNILNWIKYQNKNRRLIKETFGVKQLVDQIFGVLQSLAKQKNIQLQNNVAEYVVINQYLEPLKILIYNLITNAINFSNKGAIIISGKLKANTFILTVTDEGAGMTQEQIANIMANQFIVSSANVDNKKGNGLGYLIIKDLLKMMDATILISSQKNEGTQVAVSIPLK
jgi:signal transduction histidine kinase